MKDFFVCPYKHKQKPIIIKKIKHWDNKPQIGTYKFDLIYYLTENGHRHASGPVHAKHPIRYMYYLYFSFIDLAFNQSC